MSIIGSSVDGLEPSRFAATWMHYYCVRGTGTSPELAGLSPPRLLELHSGRLTKRPALFWFVISKNHTARGLLTRPAASSSNTTRIAMRLWRHGHNNTRPGSGPAPQPRWWMAVSSTVISNGQRHSSAPPPPGGASYTDF